jgi:hypothetical protein
LVGMITRTRKSNMLEPPGGGTLRLALLGLALIGGIFAWSVAPAPGSFAQNGPARSAVNKDLTIDKDEVVEGDVSVTNGRLIVEGEVKGKVAVVNGSAQIDGTVRGDVVVVSGDIVLGPNSTVGHDVASFGGKVVRDPSAKVGGRITAPALSLQGLNDQVQVVTSPQAPASPSDSLAASAGTGWPDRLVSFFVTGGISLIFLVVGLVIASVVPSRVAVAGATLEAEPVPSIIVGLIISFLLLPVVLILAVVLMISLVGIVLLPVLAVGVVVALLFGLVTLSSWLGRRVYEATHHGAPQNVMPVPLQVLMGMAVVLGGTFLPTLLTPRPLVVVMLGLLYFVMCTGLGAAILSRFGTLSPPQRMKPTGPA